MPGGNVNLFRIPHTFFLRSNHGNGLLDPTQKLDLFAAQCAQDYSAVFIQSTDQNGLWLIIQQSDDTLHVGTIEPITANANIVGSPTLFLSSTLSDESTSYGVACPGITSSTTGHWQILQGSDGLSG